MRDFEVQELEDACEEMETEIMGLRAKLAKATKDAERYRWLRNPLNAEIYLHTPGIDSCKAICDEGLDAAIDAAIQKE